MSSSSDDLREGGIGLIVIGVITIALLVLGGIAANAFFFEPTRQRAHSEAYVGEVQGLVVEYCSSPRASDKEANRQRISGLANGQPDNWNSLPRDLKDRAEKVQQNNAEACR